jgi:hypothetical protein
MAQWINDCVLVLEQDGTKKAFESFYYIHSSPLRHFWNCSASESRGNSVSLSENLPDKSDIEWEFPLYISAVISREFGPERTPKRPLESRQSERLVSGDSTLRNSRRPYRMQTASVEFVVSEEYQLYEMNRNHQPKFRTATGFHSLSISHSKSIPISMDIV